MSEHNGRIRTGPQAWDDLHPEVASAMLTRFKSEMPGWFGRYLAIATTGHDPVKPTRAQLQAAPDQADPAAVEGGPDA